MMRLSICETVSQIRSLASRRACIAVKKSIKRYMSVDNRDDFPEAEVPYHNIDAIKTKVKAVQEQNAQRNIFVGHGQYFQHASNERYIVINSPMPLYGATAEDNITVETVIDAAIDSAQSKRLVDILGRYSDSPVGSGEFDFVNKGKWRCGFCYSPTFSIFTREAKLLSTFINETDKKMYMRIYAYGLYDDFAVEEVEAVCVRISNEPWNEQALDVVLREDEIITILEKDFCETSDLSMLMVETEWLVKCAGLLCLDIKRRGTSKVKLELPDNLTVAGNPWVEMRHQAWVRSLDVEG